MSTWNQAYSEPRSRRRPWLWILLALGLAFLCMCSLCGVIIGPGFVQGFRQGYQQALATATVRARSENPAPVAVTREPVPAPAGGEGSSSNGTALRIRLSPLRLPKGVDTTVTVEVENLGGQSVVIGAIAFTQDLALGITDASGGVWFYENMPEGPVAGGEYQPTVTIAPGSVRTFYFTANFLASGSYTGHIFICDASANCVPAGTYTIIVE